MAYQDNNNKNKEKELLLKDFEPQMMGGTIGGLDLIGGGAVKGLFKLGKTFANAAKQYLRGGKAAEKVSNFKPLVTGNKIYDRQSINDAFAKRFGKPQADFTSIQYARGFCNLKGMKILNATDIPLLFVSIIHHARTL